MKRKRQGYSITEGGSRPPVDYWRDWAAVPLPSIKVESDIRPPGHVGVHDSTYTLEEDGVVVGTWRDSDAPWLYAYLSDRLGQLYGAWHLAREQLTLTAGQIDAGEKRARAMKAAAKIRDAALLKRARQMLKENGPIPNTELADLLADAGFGRASWILKKLPTLLRKKNTTE